MLSFTATGIPYNTPDGCAADACAASDLRSSLMGVRQAFSRLTLTMRSAAALALASASLGSITLRRPRTARAWAPGRSRLGRQGRARQVRTRGRSEEHTSELQSPCNLVCRLLLEKKKNKNNEQNQNFSRNTHSHRTVKLRIDRSNHK